ncbi:hypothetical protein AB0J28_16880 [Streptosporangium canum]|uniref:hypothetical protein n=1 Tax=Streptosporangium canum TaxID=324952 RepID=UPI003440DED6
MRLLGENKAQTRADRCRHCRRPVGHKVGHCRPTNDGHWWCWTKSTIVYDPSKLIGPTPAPIGEAEQAVIDSYAPRIADAQKAVDEALATYTVAQQTHHAVLSEAQEIGVFSQQVGIPLKPGTQRREATHAQRLAMQRRLELLYQGETEMSARLSAARVELNRLESWYAHRRRMARAAA